MLDKKVTRFISAIVVASSTVALNASASDYPQQDIRMIIPYGPGGATDAIFRLVSKEAEKNLGVSVVPVNMAGAGATTGSRYVKEAQPDGYTLLGSHDTIALSRLAGTVDYSYDAFEPVALLTKTIVIPMTYADHPVDDMAEMASYIAEHPGEVVFGMTPSSVDHFYWIQLFDAMGVNPEDVRFVGYQDTNEQIAALMAHEIDFVNADMPSSRAFFESGDFRALGVSSDQRLRGLEDVPTLREQQVDLVSATNRGIFAPKGTPDDVLDILAGAYAKALENESIKSRIENEFGSVVDFLPTDEYQQFLDENEAALTRAAENINF